MKKVTIHFHTILDMLDFESTVTTYGHIKDHRKFTITGYFEESDIELAKARYNAAITEES